MSGGSGIYGYDAPAPVSVYGRLAAAMAGVALASVIATNILAISWGPPVARVLVAPTTSRLLCGAVLVACALSAWRVPRLRVAAYAGMVVALLLALSPLYNPYAFWRIAARAARGELPGADAARVLLAALVSGGSVGVLTQQLLKLVRLRTGGVKGSTRWGAGEALKSTAEGLLLGKLGGQLLRYDRPGHLLTVAATRSGKGVGSIIPNLLHFPGSLIVTDPKGENYYVTSEWRREELGHEVVAMDPFGITKGGAVGFNPLDLIDTRGEDYVETAMMMAEMLIVKTGSGDPHWVLEAKALLYTFILHAASHSETGKRNLIEVRRMLTLGPMELDDLLGDMLHSPIPQVQEGAGRVLQKGERERSGVFSTAQSYTHFLASPRMGRVLTRSDFSLQGIVQDRLSLYLVLPMEHLTAFAPWLRLMITCAYYVCTHEVIKRPRSKHRILFLLDEFANLGYMSNIKEALSLGGGYGVSLWLILQDFAQLKRAYKDEWESFVANSDVIQAFAIQDPFSAEKVSTLLGKTTVWQRKTRKSSRKEGGRLVRDYDEDSRPLLRPEELRRMDPAKQILLVRPHQPVAATKLCYYADPMFAGRWQPNPYVTP